MFLTKNFLYNLIGQGLPQLVGLLCIPLLINNLGIPRFGFLTLLWAFLGYLAFLDLGLGRAIIKMISEHLFTNDKQKGARVFWTTAWLLFGFSVIGMTLLSVATPFIVSYFFSGLEL